MSRNILQWFAALFLTIYISLLLLGAVDVYIEKDRENRARSKEAGYILTRVCEDGRHLLPSNGGWLLSDLCWKVKQIYGAGGERKAFIAALQYVVDSVFAMFSTSWIAMVVIVGVFIFWLGIRVFGGTRVELVLPRGHKEQNS